MKVTDGTIEPFRLALINNAFTRTGLQKQMMTEFLLCSVPFSSSFVVEYTYEYISIAFRGKFHSRDTLGGVKSDLQLDASQHLEKPGSETLHKFLKEGYFSECDDNESEDETLTVFRSKVANINAALSLLKAYEEKMRKGDTKYKQIMVVLAGAIGERGTRYKTLDHKFYLTDQYDSYDAVPNKPISVHAAQKAQGLGRICSMLSPYTNVFVTPTLWTPSRCWLLDEVFLSYYHELPIFLSLKEDGERYDDAVKRLLNVGSPHAADLPAMTTLYAKSIGTDRKGKHIYLHPIPNKKKTHHIQEGLAETNKDYGERRPPMLDLHYDQESVDRGRMQAALRLVEEKGVDKALADAFPPKAASDSEEEEGPKMPSVPKRKAAQHSDAAPAKRRKPDAKERKIEALLPGWIEVKNLFYEQMRSYAKMNNLGSDFAKDPPSRLQRCVELLLRKNRFEHARDLLKVADAGVSDVLRGSVDQPSTYMSAWNHFVRYNRM